MYNVLPRIKLKMYIQLYFVEIFIVLWFRYRHMAALVLIEYSGLTLTIYVIRFALVCK